MPALRFLWGHHDLRNHCRTPAGAAGAHLPAVCAAACRGAVMTTLQILEIAVHFLLILAVTKPLGLYMRRVFSREKTFLDPLLRPLERLVYRVSGVDETKEHGWIEYTVAMLVFSAVGLLLTYAIQRLQHLLPLNPDGM